ncbi:MAG TPA: DUF2628 domain-containing protein [Clostridium sp.]|uniref:DUF2628 domain-containing protein n=1 Tax=Clostridium sp. TaxID=1506 RepID=UPI002F92EC79
MSKQERLDKFKKQFEDLDENEAKLFVGKNSDYYIKKWSAFKDGSKKWGINWPGFLFSIFWLGYRKMYLNIFYFLSVLTGIGILQYFVPVDMFKSTGTVIAVLVGGSGNTFYYIHMKKKIAKIREQNQDSSNIDKEIMKKGNGSWGGVGIALLMFIGYMFVAFILDGIFIGF